MRSHPTTEPKRFMLGHGAVKDDESPWLALQQNDCRICIGRFADHKPPLLQHLAEHASGGGQRLDHEGSQFRSPRQGESMGLPVVHCVVRGLGAGVNEHVFWCLKGRPS